MRRQIRPAALAISIARVRWFSLFWDRKPRGTGPHKAILFIKEESVCQLNKSHEQKRLMRGYGAHVLTIGWRSKKGTRRYI